jgi:hypothetical protein
MTTGLRASHRDPAPATSRLVGPSPVSGIVGAPLIAARRSGRVHAISLPDWMGAGLIRRPRSSSSPRPAPRCPDATGPLTTPVSKDRLFALMGCVQARSGQRVPRSQLGLDLATLPNQHSTRAGESPALANQGQCPDESPPRANSAPDRYSVPSWRSAGRRRCHTASQGPASRDAAGAGSLWLARRPVVIDTAGERFSERNASRSLRGRARDTGYPAAARDPRPPVPGSSWTAPHAPRCPDAPCDAPELDACSILASRGTCRAGHVLEVSCRRRCPSRR